MSFFGELRRRNVIRVGVAYMAAVWVLIQVADTVLPVLSAPEWLLRALVFSSALGFPLTLALAWFYELTPEGIRVTTDAESREPVKFTGRKIDFAIIGLLVLAIGFLLVRSPLENQIPVLPNSVAVLPFENLSPDPDNAYFAAGIHEEILNHLVKLSALNVIARTSVQQYANTDKAIPEIAEELNVETVMEGSVRYAGDAILVTAQLIDPETNIHLWSDTYPGDMSDLSTVFAMQADIAMNIANAVGAEFSVEEQASIEKQPTESSDAYNLYLRAINIPYTNIRAALALLAEAIALDPDFARAHARMANLYSLTIIQNFGIAAADLTERASVEAGARHSAEQALRLDSGVGYAHLALARIDQIYWRWTEAQEAYERALDISPNDPALLQQYARLRAYRRNHVDAIALMQRAVELDPTWNSYYLVGATFAYAGDPQAALAPTRRAVELGPEIPITRMWMARLEGVFGNAPEAADHLKIAEQLLIDSKSPVSLASIAYTYHRIGYEEDAARVLERLDDATPDRDFDAASWVLGYLVQGDEDAAFDSLQTVVDRVKNNVPDPGYNLLMIIKSNAQADPVLDQPRFQELRSQIGASD